MRKIVIGMVGIMIVITLVIAVSVYHSNTAVEAISEDYYLKDLPAKPNDYNLIRREIETGYIDLTHITKDYYLQPDFYPGWRIGQEFYTKHDYSRWGVYGHGSYPSNPEITFTSKNVGDWISFVTFYKTGYGIESWQGIKLVPVQSEYFDVKIEPDEFLLEPTFPFFRKGWVQPISITVTIKQTPPSGTYLINIEAQSPSEQNRKKWFWEVLKRESTEEELFMLEHARQMYGDEIPHDWEGWITFERKNKYVDASVFSMSGRIQLEIVVV